MGYRPHTSGQYGGVIGGFKLKSAGATNMGGMGVVSNLRQPLTLLMGCRKPKMAALRAI